MYCCKYSQINETIMRLKTENKAFKSFLKKMEMTTKHPLADFLIAPVQRVPRLALLIESLIKFTDDTHPDFESLKNALEEAQGAARLINEKMKEVEVRTKVVSIHKSFDSMIDDFLDGPLVQPHRVFIHEGVLAKKTGARANDDDWSDSEEDEDDKQEDCEKGKYYCFLFNDLFLVGTSIGKGKTKRLVYETSFELATTFIRDDMNALCFQMVNPRCTYTWLASTTQEVADWKRSVEDAVEALLKQHPNLKTQRGRVDVTLDDETNEWSAEIKATPKMVMIDPTAYREHVLENTQKHLTQFMHEHHDKLIKHRTNFGSPKKAPGSVFQRVKDSFTPKKSRASFRAGDENSVNMGSPGGYNSPIGAGVRDSFSLTQSNTMLNANNGVRKSEKLADLVAPEEIDGITCLNRHIEMLNQELAAVREARRTARFVQQPALTQRSSRASLSTSPVRRLTRGESMIMPTQDAHRASIQVPMRRHDTVAQLGSKSVIVDPLPPAPSSPLTLSKKKSKTMKNAIEKRQTIAPLPTSTSSSALGRRSTVVVAPTPASPLSIVPRAADAESLSMRKATPKAVRRGRMSLGGDSSKLSKATLPPPLFI